ncbi:DUF1294 domain-containing protein [Herbaspirillum sp. ST 5-3]|uniref:DUF1294 domain-containing protein n=1 Tax=Oxalobacteraceae TaxID=75682 RepID=UPI0010A2F2E4|nr:DUF1294 domain-containing protein [Herbaspirillum sp. ST 5-3]
MIFAASFFAVMLAAVVSDKLPSFVLIAYFAMSMATFVVYAVDKSAAQRNQWRTSERTLHLFGLAGGWPGAMIAQGLFRHKSAKRSFRSIFWLTVVLNCAALSIYLLPDIAGTAKFLFNTF